jgi:hypothetical protein
MIGAIYRLQFCLRNISCVTNHLFRGLLYYTICASEILVVSSTTQSHFSLISYFEKNKSRLMRSRSCPCVCVCVSSVVARQRLGKNPPVVARQRLGRNVTAVTNTLATIEELLDASFSVWPVSYQGTSCFIQG